MSSIEEFCTDVLILNRGKTVLEGNLKEIKQTYPANRILLSANKNIDKYIKELGLEIINNNDNQYEIEINREEEGYKLFDLLGENHEQITKFEIRKPSLHDIFIEKVGAFEQSVTSCVVKLRLPGLGRTKSTPADGKLAFLAIDDFLSERR